MNLTITSWCVQRLVKLQQEVEEIKSGTQDSDRLKRMWESLATRAQHIPNVRKSSVWAEGGGRAYHLPPLTLYCFFFTEYIYTK